MSGSRKVERRRQLRQEHSLNVRKCLFLIDYIQNKYVDIHSEAVQFFDAIDRRYPGKRDLTKTIEYKEWKRHIVASTTQKSGKDSSRDPTKSSTLEKNTETIPHFDNFQLRIPLMEMNQNTETTTVNEGTINPVEAIPPEQPTLQTLSNDMVLTPSITEEISPEVFNQAIEELQADSELSCIFNNIEVQDLEDLDIKLTNVIGNYLIRLNL